MSLFSMYEEMIKPTCQAAHPESQCSPLSIFLICVGSSLCFLSFVSEKFVNQKCWFISVFIFPHALEDLWFNVNEISSLAGENQGKLWVDLSLCWMLVVKQAWIFSVN